MGFKLQCTICWSHILLWTLKGDEELDTNNQTETTENMEPKHWFSYTESHIYTILGLLPGRHFTDTLAQLQNRSVVSFMVIHFPPQVIYERETIMKQGDPIAMPTQSVTALLFTLSAVPAEVYSSDRDMHLGTHTWLVLLDPRLRSLIHFIQLRVYGHLAQCQSSVVVLNKVTDETVYQLCGVYSGFDIYTAFHRVGYRVLYRATDDFKMLTFFDLIAPGFIQTQKYLVPLLLRKPTQLLVTFMFEEIRSELKITVNKNCLVVIHSSNFTQMMQSLMTVLFDGPDTKAPNFSFPAGQHHVCCSTFQCVLLIRQGITLVQPDTLYSFDKVSVLSSKTFLDTPENFETWRVPRAGNGMSMLWVDKIEADIGSHIQVIPSNFSFSGADHPLCLHGGIAFISIGKNVSSEMENICLMKNSHLTFLKPTFSSSNLLLVVTSVYETHGTFQGTLEISATACELLKMSLCLIDSQFGVEDVMDFMFSQKRTLGEMLTSVMGNDPTTINSTGFECVVLQIRAVHPNEQCKFPFDQLWAERYHFSTQVHIEKLTEQKMLHEVVFRGQLMSLGKFRVKKYTLTHESSLRMTVGNYIQHDSKRDANFTPFDQDKKENTSTNFGESFYRKHSSNTFMIVEPPFGKNLHFMLRMFAETPIHAHSLFFTFDCWGLFSWLDVSLRPATRHMFIWNKNTKYPLSHVFTIIEWNLWRSSLLISVNESDIQLAGLHIDMLVELQVSLHPFQI